MKLGFNYAKLRGRIKQFYIRQTDFAKDLNISNVTLSNKLNNKAVWTQIEINKTAELLKLNTNEIGEYFFTKLEQL